MSDSIVEVSLIGLLLIHLRLVHLWIVVFDKINGGDNNEIVPVNISHLLALLLVHLFLLFLVLADEVLVVESLTAVKENRHPIFDVLLDSLLEIRGNIEAFSVGID